MEAKDISVAVTAPEPDQITLTTDGSPLEGDTNTPRPLEGDTNTPRPTTPHYRDPLENTARADSLNTTHTSEVRGHAHPSPAKERPELTPHVAMARLKAVLTDMMAMLASPQYTKDIDDFTVVTQEALADLRRLKVTATSRLKPLTVPRTVTPTVVPALASTLNDAEGHDDDSKADAKARTWASLVKGPERGPEKAAATKPSPSKREELQRRQEVSPEVRRAVSAAKQEQRRSEADETRADQISEKADHARSKNVKVAERVAETKQRQKDEVESLREESKERSESATKRAEENINKIRDKNMKHSQHVDEVLFVNDIQQQNKALRIETRLMDAEQQQEARRGEQRASAKERNDAHQAVLERSRDITQLRVDRAQQREQQRLEQTRRLEEQRKAEAETRHAKSEERERKVQANQQAIEAEAESKKSRADQRITQSAHNRELLAAKRKEKEQKARDRREDVTPGAKTTVAEVLPEEEEHVNTRLAKAIASAARHGKVFSEQYQKDAEQGISDLNRSRFRALSARLAQAGTGSLARPALQEMTTFLTPVDHEYARFFNMYEHLVATLVEGRRARDTVTTRLASDVLHKLLMDATEGPAHIRYFVRAGHHTTIIGMLHDEMRALSGRNSSPALTFGFSLLQICTTLVVSEAANLRLAPVRDQLADLLEAAGVDKYCCAVPAASVEPEDMPCVEYALLTLANQIALVSKRRADGAEWFKAIALSLITLLQNTLKPISGRDEILSQAAVLVVFNAFRLLNTITRQRPAVMSDLLRNHESARMEFYHMIGAFFRYVGCHDAALERIPPETGHESAGSRTFDDAVAFGLTFQTIPRAAMPSYANDGSPFVPPPSSARSSASTTGGSGGGARGLVRAALHELLLLIGVSAVAEPQVREIFSWGQERPLLQTILTSLNFNYFTLARHILFPTLIAIVAGDERNCTIAAREMEPRSLFEFLEGEFVSLPTRLQRRAKTAAQDDAAAAASASSAAAAPLKPAVISWADLSDNDDDDGPAETGASTVDIAFSRKEKMLQLLKNCSHQSTFFRVENRVPRSLWQSAAVFLAAASEGQD